LPAGDSGRARRRRARPAVLASRGLGARSTPASEAGSAIPPGTRGELDPCELGLLLLPARDSGRARRRPVSGERGWLRLTTGDFGSSPYTHPSRRGALGGLGLPPAFVPSESLLILAHKWLDFLPDLFTPDPDFNLIVLLPELLLVTAGLNVTKGSEIKLVHFWSCPSK